MENISSSTDQLKQSEVDNKIFKLMEFEPFTDSIKSRVYPINPERVAAILQDHGYRALITTIDDELYVISSSDAWEFKIKFYDDLSDIKQTPNHSFRIFSGYKILEKQKDLFIRSAAWLNTNYRYIKAYVDEDDDYIFTEVEIDCYCIDGISDNGFMALVKKFLDLRQAFRKQYYDLYEKSQS